MQQSDAVFLTIIFFTLLLIAVGFWAKRRTNSEEDFFLGGRKLGPLVAAVSYSASAASAWTLLGLSGLAYAIGLSAIWVASGSFLGMLISWFWIGPRMMSFSRSNGLVTIIDFLGLKAKQPFQRIILLISSFIVLFCFSVYVAAQFQGAGNAFSSAFELPMSTSILLGGVIVMIYTFLGGFWAVSVTDTIQGILMAIAAFFLPLFAFIELGGMENFLIGLQSVSSSQQFSFTAGNSGLFAVGLILGSLSVGIGSFGQPHLLVRFMAIRDESALRLARIYTIIWYAVVFFGMFMLGLLGHVLFPVIDNNELIFFAVSDRVFPPVVSGVLIAAVLSAIMSTADSQLLVNASVISYDLGLGKRFPGRELFISRITIAFTVVFALIIALIIPSKIFDRVLFAWVALGSAFGPLVILRLARISCGPISIISSITVGFILAVFFSLIPNSPGDILERLAPFSIAITLLFLMRKR